ncbi:cyclopropane fatty acyl phospholipid synthase [Pantoea sp. Nvir]|uniref:cyclopropane fatty acyl phospholipid synthase n=1 Tax=Pantoea sp. Nvir TaxID=2576760 RepID=UPI0013569068|nr:cyclopropane fatty acyl phospholipid synthase [Pantoea sp. Nvir]MXP66198.1 cyclopropane fatty acyl phospholipid synthase [Pantoea sp. Nvir]CAJ0991720.1 Cyclopropane-fatty-acyl-phospholipid synthase [Pantoea sp. Nvir]
MNSLSTEEVRQDNNYYYRIIHKMLEKADIEINGSRPWDIKIKHPDFFKRVIQVGSLGLGEAYMDGWWECERLDIFFHRVLKHKLNEQLPHYFKDTLRAAAARLTNLQSKKRSWIVGKEHYDIGNDVFSLMLDPYMQYSCAYWIKADTLEQAQEAKLDMICRKLQLEPNMKLLDIGCGWGGLAAYAARNYGAIVYGVTVSSKQQKLAQQLCKGLDITIVLQDYRDLHQQFDRIVSVGMFEHVGPKNYATYFDIVRRNLKSDGLFLLHTIGALRTNMNIDPWIDKYIFPNGCLPSVRHIANASESYFILEDWHNFGADYDTTLMAWYARFTKAWPQLSKKYDERFKLMFSYYLNSCAGAFRARNIHLWQVVFSRGVKGGVLVVR